MAANLTKDQLTEKTKSALYTQSYAPQPKIEGVQVVPLKNSVGDDGAFGEIIRLTDTGTLEAFPDFKLLQINRSYMQPKAIKGWHVHFSQDDIWYVPPANQVFVGLWDMRKDSSTADTTMRLNLGGGISQLLYIPRGVAHGAANFTRKAVELYYFIDQKFNPQNPDEHRVPWDSLGKEFWTPEKD